MEGEKEYRATQVDLTWGKRAKFRSEQDVVLPHDISERLAVQRVMEPKDPRFLPDDMVLTLLQHGRSLHTVPTRGCAFSHHH